MGTPLKRQNHKRRLDRESEKMIATTVELKEGREIYFTYDREDNGLREYTSGLVYSHRHSDTEILVLVTVMPGGFYGGATAPVVSTGETYAAPRNECFLSKKAAAAAKATALTACIKAAATELMRMKGKKEIQ